MSLAFPLRHAPFRLNFMEYMIGIVIAVLALGIILFLVKRAVRLAFRMALLGVLLIGGLLAWWYMRSPSTPSNARPSTSRPARAR